MPTPIEWIEELVTRQTVKCFCCLRPCVQVLAKDTKRVLENSTCPKCGCGAFYLD